MTVMESNIYEALSEILSKLDEGNNGSSIHKILKDLYQVIQKGPKKVMNFFALSSDEQELFNFLVKHLMSIIADDAFTPESILLSSTCLSVLVAELFEPKFSSIYLPSLYCYIGEITRGHSPNKGKAKDPNKKFVQINHIQDITLNSAKQTVCLEEVAREFIQDVNSIFKKKIPTFHQVAILHGILSCQKSDLFPFRSKFFNDVPFILTMYNPIHSACLMPGTSQYHAFSVLVSWLRMCEKLLPELLKTKLLFSRNPISDSLMLQPELVETQTLFSKDSVFVPWILSLLASNWESPIKGVSTFVKEAYRILITMSKAECDVLKVDDFNMAEFILKQVIDISWKTKGKYLVLSVVFQFVDYREVTFLHPSLPHEVIFNLKAAYAASVISEVYKSIVLSMKHHNSNKDDLHSEWTKYWMNPIKQALSCNDKLLVQTVVSYIVPWTLKTLPGSYELLLSSFSDENDFAQKLTLLRVAKETGICALGAQEIDFIRAHLHHQDCHLRIHILTVLCSSTKRSESLSREELELLKEFIVENLNIDSTPFQQSFLSQLRILLVRVRDSLTQEYRVQSKNGTLSPSHPQLEFVDWLAKTAVKNTFPGAGFQRRRLSLLTLNLIFDVFVSSPLGNNRKEKPSKFVEKLVEWAQSQGVWMFFKEDLILNILPCLTDYTDEVRSTTFELLTKFSYLPPVTEDKGIFDPEFLLQYSHYLCNHPDYRSNDGGAFLMCFVYRKMFFLDNKPETSSQAVNFLNDLIAKIRGQLNTAKDNFLTAAIQSPIHGFLLGLQYCLKYSMNELEELFGTQRENIVTLVENINNLSNDIIDYMLYVMKGKDEKESCPSFSDIGEALEKLVVSAEKDSEKQDLSPQQDEKESGSSPEVDLLLSCCWHSIKNSCFLLCDLSTFICDLNMTFEEKERYLLNIAQKLSTVLIACRHRGVVEACSLALNKFCKKLLKDEVLYKSICKFLLNLVFSSLLDASNTSVTRRSAGLPCLCQAVVTSEDNNIRRKLLSYTIKKLLKCISRPLPPQHQISDKTDLPQAHAYHILKVLVMDASLSQAILAHIDNIIPACVSGFSSNLWPIRNGALQLFGVILPRICGQKKVRDDDSEHNLVSGSELFSRCPSLQTYLQEQLRKCVEMHRKKVLSSELVPVLSIMSKLSSDPGEEGYIKEFKPLLLKLLDIPVWKIRDLVASALSVMVTEKDVINLLEQIKKEFKSSSNKTHGCLLVVQKVLKKDANFFSNINAISKCLEDFYCTASKGKCWIILGLLLDLIEQVALKSPVTTKINGENVQITADFGNSIGYSMYESKVLISDLTKKHTNNSLPMLSFQDYGKNVPVISEYLKFLTSQLHSDRNKKLIEVNIESWKQVCRHIMELLNSNQHPSVVYPALSFYMDLCSDWKIGSLVLDRSFAGSLEKFLWDCLDVKFGLSAAAKSLSVLSLCIRAGLENWGVFDSHLEKWNMLFNSYSQPRSPDVKRMQAALSVSYLGPQLVNYLDKKMQTECEYSVSLLLGLCEGSILLLQDEDEEIRNKACEFPSNIPHQYKVNLLQFNVGIQVLVEYMYVIMKDNKGFLLYLWNRLQNYPSSAKVLRSTAKTTKMNLFEQEFVNVFAEPLGPLLTYKKYIKIMLNRLFSSSFDQWQETIAVFSSDANEEIGDLLLILSYENQSQLNQGFGHPHHVFLALKKLHCQVEILESQIEYVSSDSTLCRTLQSICDSWKSVETNLTVISCWFINQL